MLLHESPISQDGLFFLLRKSYLQCSLLKPILQLWELETVFVSVINFIVHKKHSTATEILFFLNKYLIYPSEKLQQTIPVYKVRIVK